MNNKTCIIACYYGKLPSWMDLWLLSASRNPDFDFLVVGDSPVSCNYPNIKYEIVPFEALKKKIKTILGFTPGLNNPYKLCDFRPLYGLIFKKELEGYDFWGHCDLDIIWGDLSKYISDDLLDRYDRIGNNGHLTLYRNNYRINDLYRERGSAFSFKTVFSDPCHYGFDEMTGMNLICQKAGIPFCRNIHIADANWLLRRISVCPGRNQREFYCWRDGRILRVFEQDGSVRLQEFSYLHFQKKHPGVRGNDQSSASIADRFCNGFYITSEEFIPRLGREFTTTEIAAMNTFRSRRSDLVEICMGQLGRVFDLLFRKSFHEKKIQLIKGIKYAITKRQAP